MAADIANISLKRSDGYPNVIAFPKDFKQDISLWRYMTLTKFLLLLEDKCLHLARISDFDDKFEGSLPKYQSEEMKAIQEMHDMPEEPAKALEYHLKIIKNYSYINCWHINEHESAAMWSIYSMSSESIAVKTSLTNLAQEVGKDAMLAAVGYIDYEKERIPFGNMAYPCIFKRKSFSYENEFRVISCDLQKMTALAPPDKFQVVDVDLGSLIERIYIAPNAPGHFKDLVEKLVERYGYTFEVTRSEIDKEPFY